MFTVLLQVLNHIKRVACDKKICAAAEMNEVAYWVCFILWYDGEELKKSIVNVHETIKRIFKPLSSAFLSKLKTYWLGQLPMYCFSCQAHLYG
jgi:hypothetical protein